MVKSKIPWKILFGVGILFNMISSLFAAMDDEYPEAIWYLMLVGIILYVWDTSS